MEQINEQISDWKAIVTRCSAELQSTKQKGEREETIKLLREKAKNIYMEVHSDSVYSYSSLRSIPFKPLLIRHFLSFV